MKHSKKTFKFLTLRAQITLIVEKIWNLWEKCDLDYFKIKSK